MDNVSPASPASASSSPYDSLLWFDLETTGLDAHLDLVLQVGAARADADGNITASKEWVIRWPKEVLDVHFDPVRAPHRKIPLEMHTKSGLLARCYSQEGVTLAGLDFELRDWIDKTYADLGDVKPYLSGNSIHFDRRFLISWFPDVVEKLHHRMLDVSALKVAAEVWGLPPLDKGDPAHLVMDDIRWSLREFRHWKSAFWRYL